MHVKYEYTYDRRQLQTCGYYTITILILTNTELLVDNASLPAGGPFIVLLPAGGPFIFLPLVDNASVTAGGPFHIYLP